MLKNISFKFLRINQKSKKIKFIIFKIKKTCCIKNFEISFELTFSKDKIKCLIFLANPAMQKNPEKKISSKHIQKEFIVLKSVIGWQVIIMLNLTPRDALYCTIRPFKY